MAWRQMVIAVGRIGQGPEAQLCAEYQKRLQPTVEIHEIDDRRRKNGVTPKAWEAEQILGKLTPGAYICALDERGAVLSSQDIAALTNEARALGRDLIFVIGGADGLDDRVRQRADKMLAFGRATWPHKLVRAMVLEQLYRAATILTGHPYHRV